MNGENRLLLTKLTELAQHRAQLDDSEMDDLKARFLTITSTSNETIAEIERLGYETVSQRDGAERSGIVLLGAGVLLSDFLLELARVPRRSMPDLCCSYEDYQAALTACWAILRALEWSSFDQQHVQEYSDEKAASLIAAHVRELRNHRHADDT